VFGDWVLKQLFSAALRREGAASFFLPVAMPSPIARYPAPPQYLAISVHLIAMDQLFKTKEDIAVRTKRRLPP
jgi:hypothetical protein